MLGRKDTPTLVQDMAGHAAWAAQGFDSNDPDCICHPVERGKDPRIEDVTSDSFLFPARLRRGVGMWVLALQFVSWMVDHPEATHRSFLQALGFPLDLVDMLQRAVAFLQLERDSGLDGIWLCAILDIPIISSIATDEYANLVRLLQCSNILKWFSHGTAHLKQTQATYLLMCAEAGVILTASFRMPCTLCTILRLKRECDDGNPCSPCTKIGLSGECRRSESHFVLVVEKMASQVYPENAQATSGHTRDQALHPGTTVEEHAIQAASGHTRGQAQHSGSKGRTTAKVAKTAKTTRPRTKWPACPRCRQCKMKCDGTPCTSANPCSRCRKAQTPANENATGSMPPVHGVSDYNWTNWDSSFYGPGLELNPFENSYNVSGG
jgi:hypothetical protein